MRLARVLLVLSGLVACLKADDQLCISGDTKLRSVQSVPIQSADGRWIARFESERRSATAQEGSPCIYASRILMRGKGVKEWQTVFAQHSTPDMIGNRINSAIWSHRGHILAAELWWWQEGSDYGGITLLLYNADTKTSWQPDVLQLFNRHFRKECSVNLQTVKGFDEQDRPLIEVDDVIEPSDDAPTPATRCVGKKGIWAVDEAGGDVVEVGIAGPA